MENKELIKWFDEYTDATVLPGLNTPIAPAPSERPTDKKARLKRGLWKDQDGKCAYCDKPFVSFNDSTIDHIIPRSRGGKLKQGNIVLVCRKCNGMKGNVSSYKQALNRVTAFAVFMRLLKQKGYLK